MCYQSEISKIVNDADFKKLYKQFIESKTPINYYNLVSYITKKTRDLKNIYNESKKKSYQISSYLTAFYDDENKMIMNTLYYDTGYNSYDNYDAGLIVLNINGYNTIKNFHGVSKVFMQTVTTKKQKCSSDNKKWKQVMYFGYYVTSDQMKNIIELAHQNGVTHLIIPFILLQINNNGTNDSVSAQTGLPIEIWVSYTDTQKDEINTLLNNYGIVMLCSFGGATTFNSTVSGSNTGCQYVLNSPNYQDPYVLANDIVELLNTNKIYNVDFDIEHFPECDNFDANYNYLVYYYGLLHKYTKEIFKQKYGVDALITGAPQIPYFSCHSNYNNYSWCKVYNKIEKYFGNYIDFYNIQYYNQLYYSYSDYKSIFEYDYLFNSSILELSKCIPLHKLVLGKFIKEEVYYEPEAFMGYVPLYDENLMDTMSNFIEKTKNSKNKVLNKWFKTAGIMVWLYNVDLSTNTTLLQYYNYCNNLHA